MATPSFKSLYLDFLSQVKKSRIGTVIPIEFANLFNQAQEEVITNKLAAMEINKKVTSDLLPLFKSVKGGVTTLATGEMNKCFLYERPADLRRESKVSLLLDSLYNVKCNLLKGNMETELLNSVYGKPTIRQTYYKFDNISAKTYIKMFVPVLTANVKIYLEYFAEPTIVTDANVISDTTFCMFSKEMCTEIINVASRMCIEKNQDARYQTYNNELKQKNSNS